jgi:hypothetical protein
MKEKKFLEILEKEASSQSLLDEKYIIPKEIAPLASFFIEKFWKVLLFISAVLAILKTYYETKTI